MNEQENLRVVQQAYAAFKRGDIPTVLNSMADDVQWFLPGPQEIVPVAGRRRGRDQVAQFFKTLAEVQKVEQFEPQEFVAQGDKVIALGNYRWQVKSTGKTFGSDWAHVFTLQNGKIVKFHEYWDTHAGVTAYGGAKTTTGR